MKDVNVPVRACVQEPLSQQAGLSRRRTPQVAMREEGTHLCPKTEKVWKE